MIGLGFYNADCMEILPTIPDRYFDLAIVDPPYGIGIDRAAANSGGRKTAKGAAFKTEYKAKGWDDKRPGPEYFKELIRVSKTQIVWGGELL